ncbi:DUF7657 domain-containing protein [Clostridium vincentii]|uniref:Glycosyltransferase RgtA/B/C/D-like domain-containing protein n=1 Tax=Clostridium vincentii TaxID=52704 RepID=A0A2T0BGT7_9CLOT|nr:hypothetical protein [Clostridium vincentii]PRR83053.1 hypothetical protein CLVI_13020 [Clostridium vincentii]
MKEKTSKITRSILPLLILYILNYYIGKYGESSNGHVYLKYILITIIYCSVYIVINTKNKYLNILNIHRIRYYILAIIFIILVLFKIQGSSIGIWDDYYKDYGGQEIKTVYAGVPRDVRSDEWLVQTPIYLSQVTGEGTLSRINPNIRSDGQDIVVSAYSPALDITNIGKPFNWGFFFLDKERGLSWYWNLKLLGLFILSYEMALILGKRNKSIAVIGAMLITFASASQWWFSSIVDLIIFSQALVVSIYYYLRTSNVKLKIVNTLLFIIAGIGFVISLYPPIQVPLGYLTLIFLVFIVLKNKHKIKRKDITIFLISVILIFAVIGYFVYTAMDALTLLSSTVYPGARVELGGSRDFASIGNYLFGWLLPYKDVPYANSSELSGYISLLPVVIILFFFRNRKDRNNKLIIAVVVFMLIMCSFTLFKYPEFLAKITLFSYVPESRMRITLGLAGTYLICLLLPNLLEKKNKTSMAIIVTVVSLGILFIPLYKSQAYEYLGAGGTIMAIILFAILIYYIVKGYVKEMVPFVVVFMLITGFFVNPVCSGVAPIYEKEVSKAITRINEVDSGKWAAVDSLVGGEFLNANGVEVFNSAHHYPDLNMWQSLDENNEYENVYNRFAHIIVEITEKENSFELAQNDVVKVNININELDKTGIKYFMSGNDLSEFNKDGETIFEELYFNTIDNVYIYEYVS